MKARINHFGGKLCGRLVATVGLVPLAMAGGASAQAPTAAAAPGDLQAQVRSLTALVQRLSEHDQALQAQVQALQQRLDERPVAAAAAPPASSDVATPRVAQNAADPWAALAGAGLIYLVMLPFSRRSFHRLRADAEALQEEVPDEEPAEGTLASGPAH